MAIYAISGVLLIFRPTDFLKFDETEVRQLSLDLNGKQVASKIKVKGLKVVDENDSQVVLKMGSYN